jgi:arylsulfatase A-like enzyme
MAEMLSDAGYATGIFGKWHLGHTEVRFPTDQGFDEWYGIPNSADESFWPDARPIRRARSMGRTKSRRVRANRTAAQTAGPFTAV